VSAGSSAAGRSRCRVEAEGQARLHDQVDILLELVGDAEIPHRRRDQHTIGNREAHHHALDHGEGVALRIVERPSGAARIFRLQRRAVELRQALVPQVQRVDVPTGMGFRKTRDESVPPPALEAESRRGEARR